MTDYPKVDGRGIPVEQPGDREKGFSKGCPENPCELCTGNSSTVKSRDKETREITYQASWEWCQEMDTCAATIDWDRIFGHD